MSTRVLILGAGFGGLELSTMLSEAFGGGLEVTLIDKSDAFVFGFSKLDVMFGRTTPDAVRLPYRDIAKPGVRFLQETITAIDPEARRVTTDAGVHEADVLVVALGADYDFDATPGLADGGNEFYTEPGAARAGRDRPDVLGGPRRGRRVRRAVQVPSGAERVRAAARRRADRARSERQLRDLVRHPAPTAGAAVARHIRRARDGIRQAGDHLRPRPPHQLDRSHARRAALDDGTELPFELFLGVPKHRAPEVVIASGMTEDGYVPVDSATLRTRYPGVYAVGDVATAGVPKAGVFAEGAARVVARQLIAELRDGERPGPYDGRGSCYIEFGSGRVGRVDIDFLSGPTKTGSFNAPSAAMVAEKEHFGSSRRARWFGA